MCDVGMCVVIALYVRFCFFGQPRLIIESLGSLCKLLRLFLRDNGGSGRRSGGAELFLSRL